MPAKCQGCSSKINLVRLDDLAAKTKMFLGSTELVFGCHCVCGFFGTGNQLANTKSLSFWLRNFDPAVMSIIKVEPTQGHHPTKRTLPLPAVLLYFAKATYLLCAKIA